MPLTPELRRGVDQIRGYLWAGGYPDPMQNAEQLSFLFFFYLFEGADMARVRGARRPGAEPYASAFDGEWELRTPATPGAPARPPSRAPSCAGAAGRTRCRATLS